jgi:hypothetical protein
VEVTAINLFMQMNQIVPWMPNGYGNQTLYNIRLGYTQTGSPFQPQVLYDRIGFRTVELIQDVFSGRFIHLNSFFWEKFNL